MMMTTSKPGQPWVHVRDRMAADLGHHLNQLAALAVPAAGNTLKVEGEMTDPRFDQPLSGLYWQIDRGAKPELRSRSLWDSTLALPDNQLRADNPSVLDLTGPGGPKLLAVSRRIRLAGVPSEEVLPLADEINRFLSIQKSTIERARWRASDLAHGLKTPLATMSALADELLRSGNDKQAAKLSTGIDTMQAHIERQLAIARSRGGSSAITNVTHRIGETISNMIDVLRKLPRERPIDWSVSGDVEATAPIDAADFDEILGNLLSNANKWAQSSVSVCISSESGGLRFSVKDDGPGISAENVGVALQRGVGLDERVHGSGLGLSIVQSILETYGSELHLSRSETGGLKAEFLISRHSTAVPDQTRM